MDVNYVSNAFCYTSVEGKKDEWVEEMATLPFLSLQAIL